MTITDDYERRVLSGALNLYRRQLVRRIDATARRDWKPPPDSTDANSKRIRTVDELMARWNLERWHPPGRP